MALGLLASLVLLLSIALVAQAAPLVPEVSQTNGQAALDPWLGVAGALGVLTVLAGIAVGLTRSPWTPGSDRDPAPPDRDPPAFDPENPEDPELPAGFDGVLRLAQAAAKAGEYEDAATWFQAAVDLRPDLQVGHLCLGLCLEELGKHEEALACLDEAVNLDPEDGLPRYARARVLVQVQRTGDAISALEPLVQADEAVADVAAEDPAFRELRDHPRFLAVLGRL